MAQQRGSGHASISVEVDQDDSFEPPNGKGMADGFCCSSVLFGTDGTGFIRQNT